MDEGLGKKTEIKARVNSHIRLYLGFYGFKRALGG
jgi:hypothetical protein